MRKAVQRVLARPVWLPKEPQGVRYAFERYRFVLLGSWIALILFIIAGVLDKQVVDAFGKAISMTAEWVTAGAWLCFTSASFFLLRTDNLRQSAIFALMMGPYLLGVVFMLVLNAIVN